ncbi:hypothetical protein RB195_004430 [Necator americanus]|uniref:Uncharacterized protein n=1 Tax=Necator americanus TaxID=51031 RepID=A0ABR1BHY8_NECAM
MSNTKTPSQERNLDVFVKFVGRTCTKKFSNALLKISRATVSCRCVREQLAQIANNRDENRRTRRKLEQIIQCTTHMRIRKNQQSLLKYVFERMRSQL